MAWRGFKTLTLCCLLICFCRIYGSVINEDENQQIFEIEPNIIAKNRFVYKFAIYEKHNRNFSELNDNTDCELISSIDEFPTDLFTEEERLQGAIILHIVGAIYFFTLLAVVCNDYFLPSVECICNDLNISKDVAAATFMATATTTPEFFTNVISTFIIDSDMGLGTIIGSLMFNTLGVAAVAGLASIKPVQLDWWPITRDCIIFSTNIIILVCFSWDSQISLKESIGLVVLYFIYFIVLFQNKRIMRTIDRIVEKKRNYFEQRNSYDLKKKDVFVNNNHCHNKNQVDVERLTPNIDDSDFISKSTEPIFIINEATTNHDVDKVVRVENNEIVSEEGVAENPEQQKVRKTLWTLPMGKNWGRSIWWYYTWPIKFLLTLTIPNPKTYRKLYPLTFALCILFIGINSYMIVWMITVIGSTYFVPESVMGLTFLAAGGCMPEAISSVLMIRKGEGGIGVSNSLGANSLAILLSLGVPWLIRNIINVNNPEKSFVTLQSSGIEYTILSLLGATIILYIVIWLAKYRLRKVVGAILLVIYLVFITICILIEMGYIFQSQSAC